MKSHFMECWNKVFIIIIIIIITIIIIIIINEVLNGMLLFLLADVSQYEMQDWLLSVCCF